MRRKTRHHCHCCHCCYCCWNRRRDDDGDADGDAYENRCRPIETHPRLDQRFPFLQWPRARSRPRRPRWKPFASAASIALLAFSAPNVPPTPQKARGTWNNSHRDAEKASRKTRIARRATSHMPNIFAPRAHAANHNWGRGHRHAPRLPNKALGKNDKPRRQLAVAHRNDRRSEATWPSMIPRSARAYLRLARTRIEAALQNS